MRTELYSGPATKKARDPKIRPRALDSNNYSAFWPTKRYIAAPIKAPTIGANQNNQS